MKKLAMIFTTLLLALQTTAALAISERYVSGDYVYRLNDGKASIIVYNGTATDLELPSHIDGYPVTKVALGKGNIVEGIQTVTIPYGVEVIGSSAFERFTDLVSVTIPDSVTTIEYRAFADCNSLTSIAIPESVTTIEVDAITNCDNLTVATVNSNILGNDIFGGCNALTTVYLNGALTEIPESAFYACKGLSSITIPETVTKIGKRAFHMCSALSAINIPEGVTELGYGAFGNCSNLTSVIFQNPNTAFQTTFADGPVLAPNIPTFEGSNNISIYAFEGTQAHAYAMEKQLPYTQLARVELNGEQLKFDVPPMLEKDRVLVPMRKIFETLGAEVSWNDESQTATAVTADKTIELQIDRAAIKVNGEEHPIDVSPKMMFNRTLVPVRAVSESMGLSVEWDNAAQTVIINN